MFTRHFRLALLVSLLAATGARGHQGAMHPTGLDACDDIRFAHAWFFLHGSGVEDRSAQNAFEPQEYTLKSDAQQGYAPKSTVKIAWALGAGHITKYSDFVATILIGNSRSYVYNGNQLPLAWTIKPYIDGWSGVFTVILEHKTCPFSMVARAKWSMENPCATCPILSCAGEAEINSVNVRIPVGVTNHGGTSIQLEYLSEQVANEGVAKLALRGHQGLHGATVQKAGNIITGVGVGDHLASVIPDPSPEDPNRFRVEVSYDKSDPANTIYRQAVVENITLPDSTPALRYTDTVTGRTDVHVFSRPDANTWVLEEDGHRRTTKTTLSETAATRVFRFQVEERNASGAYTTTSVRDEHETRYGWGWETTMEVLDPQGEALTTTWDYYGLTEFSGPNGDITGRGSLQSVTDPTGLTRSYEYHDTDPLDPAFSKLTITREAFAGTPDAKETRRHSTSNGLTLTERVETWVNGILVEHTDIAASAPSVSSAAGWRTETRYPSAGGTPHLTRFDYEANPNTPLEETTTFPDGTVEVITNAYAGGVRTTSTYRGTRNPGTGLPILTGTENRTSISDSGQILQSARFRIDNGSAFRIEERLAIGLDTLSRPTDVEVYFGAQPEPSYTEITEYGCCGISKLTGRDGIPTHRFYDALGRLRKVHRNGLATETVYDGLTTRTHLYPEEAASALSLATSATEAASVTLNLAGDTTTERNRSPRDGSLVSTSVQTNYAPGNGIGRRVVRTLPGTPDDLGVAPTLTEDYYLDGALASRTGPLVADQQVDLAANANGIAVTTSLLDGNGAAHQAVTIQHDWLGRPVSRTFAGDADGNGQPDREVLGYDLGGRLARRVDPDGVTTLWSHDLLNETTTSAIDLNGNAAIDLDVDEVRLTRTGIESNGAGRTIEWTEELVRDTPGTETLVTRSEARADGLESWRYTYTGGTSARTHSLTTHLPGLPGAWDTTIRHPDQTTLVRRIRGGLPDHEESIDADGTSLATRTYRHDDHQRLFRIDDTSGPSLETAHVSPLVDAISSRTIGTRLTRFSRDHRGRLTVVDEPDSLDASGALVDNRRVTAYWPHGAPREVTGTPGYHLSYTYDDALRLETLTTHGTTTATTRWKYDPNRGWLTTKLYNSPTPGQGSGPAFAYTAAGRLDTRTSRRAIVTDHDYGVDGRLTRTDYSDGTPSTVINERDRRGRIARLSDAGGERQFHYSNQAALEDEAYQPGHLLAGWSIHQSRDGIQRLTGLALRSNSIDKHHAGYLYDAAGRLDSVESNTLKAYYHYDPTHLRVRQVSIVDHQDPLLFASRSYDSLNRLERISYHDGDLGGNLTVFSDYHYARDDYGRIQSATLRDRTQWRYAYHPTGELASARRFREASSDTRIAGHTLGWNYDGIGNRTNSNAGGDSAGAGLRLSTYTPDLRNQFSSIQRPGAAEVFGEAPPGAAVTVNGANATRDGPYFRHELTADNSSGPVWQPVTIQSGPDTSTGNLLIPPAQVAPAYDLDGNLENDGIYAYSWDAENRLVGAETTPAATAAGIPYARLAYLYDSHSRRLQRLRFDTALATTPVESTRYLYAGWRCLGELDALGQLARTLTWGLDNHDSLHLGDGNGALLWLHDHPTKHTHLAHFDGNGNLTGLSSAQSHQQTAHYLYSPFGRLLTANGPYARQNPYRFSTHHQDPATGLLDYGYRNYDPETGRWLSRDPLGEDGGVNLYGIAGNDFLNAHDELGLYSSFGHAMAISAAWGVAGAYIYGEVENWRNRKKAKKEALKQGKTECDLLRDALLKAQLANAAYGERYVPEGWSEVDSIHYRSGLDASVYQGPGGRTVIAFRGTTDAADWKTNFIQGTGLIGPQYRELYRDPGKWAKRFPNAEVVGHSLGGGLASVYGTRHGRKTTTFNPAGIHPATTRHFGIGGYSDYQEHVQRYTVRGEVLNSAQDAIRLIAPDSQGVRHRMWPAELEDPVTLHVMDPVMAAIQKRLDTCCNGR